MRSSEQSRDASVYRAPERGIGTPHGTHGEPSATDAVERVLDAGQRLVTEGIELAKLDVQEAVSEKLSQGAAIVVPGLFAFGGWWILMAALVVFLETYLVLPASLAIVGGAHLLIGGGIAAAVLSRAHARAAAKNGNGHAAGARP
jgi:hypothetical protein